MDPRAVEVHPIDKAAALTHSCGMRFALLSLLVLTLGGCTAVTVASAAVAVVTLPVKVASAGIDAATTSQAEADEKRGKAERKMLERCRKGKARQEDRCPQASR